MALQYPGISYLKGYDGKVSDIFDQWNAGQEAGRNSRDEDQAGGLLAKLFGAQNGGGQQAAGGLTTGGGGLYPDSLVNGSVDAAMSAEDPMLASYFASTRRAESGGNDSAKNPNSSATGRYQFLDATWGDLMQRHPELGLTPDGRNDPAQQEAAMKAFTMDNARQLTGAGVGVNPGTLYAAHFLGAGGASKVLSADPSTPVASIVGPEVIQANPQLAGMTVADFQQWAASKGGNGQGGYAGPTMATPNAGGGQQRGNLNPELMSELFANRTTRPLAIELMKSVASGATAKPIEINNRLVDPYTGQVIQDFSDTAQPLTTLAKLKADLDGGRISQAQYDAAVAKETTTSGGTSLRVNPATGEVEFQQGGGKPLTEGQSKDTVYATRANGAIDVLDEYDTELTNFGQRVMSADPTGIVRGKQSPEFQQAEQAGLEFLQALLRKDTGAAITPAETAEYGKVYLPQPGDTPQLLEQKRLSRRRAVKAIEAGLPPQGIVAMEKALMDTNAAPVAPSGPTKTIGGKTYYQDEAGDWYEQ